MFSRQKLIPTPSYVWPTSPEPDGGVATAVVLSPAGMGARAPLGSIHSTTSLARHRKELSGSLPGQHPPLAVPGQGRNFHTHTQLHAGAPVIAMQSSTSLLQVPVAAASPDRAWTARFLILIRHTRIYYPGYISPNRMEYGIYFDLILYRVQFGQRSFLFPPKQNKNPCI
jgi:hypothetical protein